MQLLRYIREQYDKIQQTLQNNAIQDGATHHNAIHYGTIKYNAIQNSTVHYNAVH